jgi:PadR family transcriptional regulator PadR
MLRRLGGRLSRPPRSCAQRRAQSLSCAPPHPRFSPVDIQMELTYAPFAYLQEGSLAEVLQGTLDLMVLKTLESMGPLHGYAIARRIEQVSGDLLHLNQGTLYPALLRLQQRGWIAGRWGTSENNRRARFYGITRAGRKQLAAEAADWEHMAAIISRLLQTPQGA